MRYEPGDPLWNMILATAALVGLAVLTGLIGQGRRH